MSKLAVLIASVLVATSAQAAASKGGSPITCSPAQVRSGDTVAIKTSKPFNYLAFKGPTKRADTEMLIYPADPAAGGNPEALLMDWQAFAKARAIDVKVASAKFQRPGVKGPASIPVFDKPGTYTFMVSENMESDDGTPTYECKVKYLGA